MRRIDELEILIEAKRTELLDLSQRISNMKRNYTTPIRQYCDLSYLDKIRSVTIDLGTLQKEMKGLLRKSAS